MDNTIKICDAADWFDPEIKSIIEKELKEPARFHRKQWEFAMIFYDICFLIPRRRSMSLMIST